MAKDENREYSGFNSRIGTEFNPILLLEVIIYGKRPNWFKRNILNPINRGFIQPVGKFINDEILLNKDNIRVRNAQRNPEAMNAVQKGGNIAGAIIAAPFAAYTAVLTAPVLVPALKIAGLALTPSTWIGGGMKAAGLQAPNWLLNGADFAVSAHYANEAGKEIDKNGLTWKTGFNALMSAFPLTRETKAIEATANSLRKPMSSIGSVIDDFRTIGNKATNAPFVRTGTWTYTSNTKPVFVFDKGNWRYSYNPEIYQGVNPEKIIAGNLSKLFVFELSSKPNPRILAKKLGVITISEPKEISISDLGGYVAFNSSKNIINNKLTDDAVEQFILPWEQQLRQFYNSGFYAKRLAKAGLLSKRDDILNWKNKNLNRAEYRIEDSLTMGDSYGITSIYNSEVNPKPYISFNIDKNHPLKHTIIHEGSHASSLSIPEIRLHNDKLLQNIWDNVRPEMKNEPEVKEYIEYITDANMHSNNPNALISEMGGQLQNAFLYMLRNNLTVDLLLSDTNYINEDFELRNAIVVFKPDYLKKLLAPGGIISSILLTTNAQNNDN